MINQQSGDSGARAPKKNTCPEDAQGFRKRKDVAWGRFQIPRIQKLINIYVYIYMCMYVYIYIYVYVCNVYNM